MRPGRYPSPHAPPSWDPTDAGVPGPALPCPRGYAAPALRGRDTVGRSVPRAERRNGAQLPIPPLGRPGGSVGRGGSASPECPTPPSGTRHPWRGRGRGRRSAPDPAPARRAAATAQSRCGWAAHGGAVRTRGSARGVGAACR